MPPAAQSQHYTPDGLASAEPPGPAGHTAGKTHYHSQREGGRDREGDRERDGEAERERKSESVRRGRKGNGETEEKTSW